MSLERGRSGLAADDALADAFYPVSRRLFDPDGDFVANVRRKLAQARMPAPVELYLSRALAVGVLAGLVCWLAGTLLGYALFRFGVVDPGGLSLGIPVSSESTGALLRALVVPTTVGISGIFFGTLGFSLGFGSLLSIPYFRADARAREIDALLADSVSFMYALSVGGMNQLEILEAMAKAGDTYGEVSREFRSIVSETEYFGTDYRTAIRQQADETPSEDLEQFLTDMLSIVNTGGNIERFLYDKKEKHLRTAKQKQQLTLETLELFGEMYMTLSLFPLLLVIVLVIMSMMGNADELMLYGTIYALIPLVGVGFLVLVSTVKHDDPGDGYLSPTGGSERLEASNQEGLTHLGLVEQFVGDSALFDRVKSREGTHKTLELLSEPHQFFRENPVYTLALTVPAALVVLLLAFDSGAAPTAPAEWVARPIWSTVLWFYAPAYIVFVPLAFFYEWNVYSRAAITGRLSETLRKLSSANDSGQTLLESIQTVVDTSSGKLADELEIIYAKVHYGMSLRDALVEFNNKYHLPRLARTVKLISEAQEASSEITDVLTTAAQASENQDDIDRERKSRARMQVAIILMTYLTLLAVMAILQTQFIGVMSGLSGGAGGAGESASSAAGDMDFAGGVDADVLSLLFFHAVTIQALLSGFISGYIRDASLVAGVKYAVPLLTIALTTWVVVA